jgi:hypothetical protein
MDELIFAMIVAIVGSVMVFMTILALFYFLGLISIKMVKNLKVEWDKEEDK